MRRLNSFPNSQNLAIKSLFSFFSSLSKTHNTNPILLNYLIETLKIPESRALVISNKYSHIKSLEKQQTVRQFFRNVGLSDNHIQLAVSATPKILFSDINKTLKPKIELFQRLGFVGSDLGKFVSKNSFLLAVSLEKKLIPCVKIIQKILADRTTNENLIRVVSRCNWILTRDPEKSGLLRNIEYLKSCGIVGSQLSALLVRQTRLFCFEELKLRQLVLRLLDMGFSTDSRMFVHGLDALCCFSEETVDRKLDLFRSYGFSKEEFMEMFRRAPGIIRSSEGSLKSRLEFFLKEIKFKKSVLVHNPVCLTLSVENRVIPRYRVFQIVMSRGMLKKELSFRSMLLLSEENFLEKFVLSFGEDAEELLLAYKGHKLGPVTEGSEGSWYYAMKTSSGLFHHHEAVSGHFNVLSAMCLSSRVYVDSLLLVRCVGFSDTHIQLAVYRKPSILFADVNKTLKPKIGYFQQLGLVGSDLGKFISKYPNVLSASLERKLIPCVEILKEILAEDSNNEDLIRVIRRMSWDLVVIDPEKSGLLRNIEYLKSCGIVGSQLSMLLVRLPRLFCFNDLKLRQLVLRVLDMGFTTDSRMFVHGLGALCCLSEKTFDRKLDLFRSYGFSKEECIEMIRTAPRLLSASEERLKSGLDFFLKKIEFGKAVLVRRPCCMMYSIENRVIPRYRVFQIVTARRMLKKDWSFYSVLVLSEENFLNKYVLSFGDDAEELLLAYKGHKLGASS
ncbi:hypothetical protein WN944_023544 [Citrus x changshan-huyou]|uniref:Uncharacterized protein n=1 Tax=Citrus x changshan-huyou TaxID=2935761 RepID=A0AAP0N3A8_9ROSI